MKLATVATRILDGVTAIALGIVGTSTLLRDMSGEHTDAPSMYPLVLICLARLVFERAADSRRW